MRHVDITVWNTAEALAILCEPKKSDCPRCRQTDPCSLHGWGAHHSPLSSSGTCCRTVLCYSASADPGDRISDVPAARSPTRLSFALILLIRGIVKEHWAHFSDLPDLAAVLPSDPGSVWVPLSVTQLYYWGYLWSAVDRQAVLISIPYSHLSIGHQKVGGYFPTPQH